MPHCSSEQLPILGEASQNSWQKRPFTPTTYHSQAASDTTSMHEGGSAAPRTPGKDGPDMETSAHHRSTRNTAALASPGVMAVYLELQSLYPHKLNYFTKNQLNYQKKGYFPSPLPDP